MNNEITYKGTRWFKCDLHLHTPASKCFEDKTVTPEQWVDKVWCYNKLLDTDVSFSIKY